MSTHARHFGKAAAICALSCLYPVAGIRAQSSWEQYKPGRILDLVARERAAALADPQVPDTIMIVSGDRLGIRTRVTYAGRSRQISNVHRELFRRWRTTMGLPAAFDSLFAKECLFREDGLDLWLPVQEPVRIHMQDELKVGGEVTALVSYVGALRRGITFDWLLVVNEYSTSASR